MRTNKTSGELDTSVEVLRGLLARLTEGKDHTPTAVPSLDLFCFNEPSEPKTAMYEPSICLLGSGSKQVTMGEETVVYDAHHYLLTSLDVPTVVQIPTASRAEPCMGVSLKLDLREVAQMMAECELPAPRVQQSGLAIMTGTVTPPLLDAVIRLVRLLEEPKDVSIMAPIIKKEIIYRLLVSDQGMRLRKIANTGSQSHQVSQAIGWLKANFAQPLRIDALARKVGMSTSTFHSHFRSMTALSPLQFQKHLRLQEARRKMLMDHLDAATASFEVGYESPSQFSREYSRMFGAPPHRDITQLRELAAS